MLRELKVPAEPGWKPEPRRRSVTAPQSKAVVAPSPRVPGTPAARSARHADAPPRLATPQERPGCAASRVARKVRGSGCCEPEVEAPTGELRQELVGRERQ